MNSADREAYKQSLMREAQVNEERLMRALMATEATLEAKLSLSEQIRKRPGPWLSVGFAMGFVMAKIR